jgi:uncharacterized protein (DUF433 family)
MIRYEHITFDKSILGGKPILRGSRVSVEVVLEWVASGATIEKIIESFPHLTREAVTEAVLYAKDSLKNEIFIESSED